MPSAKARGSSTFALRTPRRILSYRGEAMDFQKALNQVAEKYRSEGYNVLMRPNREHRPAFAANEELDILAYKGDEKVVVAVKVDREDLRDDPTLGDLAEVVNHQPGWRFDLVVLNANRRIDPPPPEATEPSEEGVLRDL